MCCYRKTVNDRAVRRNAEANCKVQRRICCSGKLIGTALPPSADTGDSLHERLHTESTSTSTIIRFTLVNKNQKSVYYYGRVTLCGPPYSTGPDEWVVTIETIKLTCDSDYNQSCSRGKFPDRSESRIRRRRGVNTSWGLHARFLALSISNYS